jgi:hypothetical protein
MTVDHSTARQRASFVVIGSASSPEPVIASPGKQRRTGLSLFRPELQEIDDSDGASLDRRRVELVDAALPNLLHSGGDAFRSRLMRYASNIRPACGAPGVASSPPHVWSKRGAFGSDVPSDSPGTLRYR